MPAKSLSDIGIRSASTWGSKPAFYPATLSGASELLRREAFSTHPQLNRWLNCAPRLWTAAIVRGGRPIPSFPLSARTRAGCRSRRSTYDAQSSFSANSVEPLSLAPKICGLKATEQTVPAIWKAQCGNLRCCRISLQLHSSLTLGIGADGVESIRENGPVFAPAIINTDNRVARPP
jgi:hypothetical protein